MGSRVWGVKGNTIWKQIESNNNEMGVLLKVQYFSSWAMNYWQNKHDKTMTIMVGHKNK